MVVQWRLSLDGQMSERPGISPLCKLVCEVIEREGHTYQSLAPLLYRTSRSLYVVLAEVERQMTLAQAYSILAGLGYDLGFEVRKKTA